MNHGVASSSYNGCRADLIAPTCTLIRAAKKTAELIC